MTSELVGKSIPKFSFAGEPLDSKKAEDLFGLIVASMKGDELPLEKDAELMKEFLAKVTEARIRVYELPFNITNLFMLASVLTFVDTPGMVMGMLWLAKRRHDETGRKLMTVSDWCEIFPWGTPTKKECEAWWDSQKIKKVRGLESDNLVDYRELWG